MGEIAANTTGSQSQNVTCINIFWSEALYQNEPEIKICSKLVILHENKFT